MTCAYYRVEKHALLGVTNYCYVLLIIIIMSSLSDLMMQITSADLEWNKAMAIAAVCNDIDLTNLTACAI